MHDRQPSMCRLAFLVETQTLTLGWIAARNPALLTRLAIHRDGSAQKWSRRLAFFNEDMLTRRTTLLPRTFLQLGFCFTAFSPGSRSNPTRFLRWTGSFRI